MIPVHASHDVSPRAERLGQRLAETIQTFRREHGELTGAEVRQALHVAAVRTSQPASRAVLGILLGILVAGGVSAFVLGRTNGGDAPVIAVVLTVAALLFVTGYFLRPH